MASVYKRGGVWYLRDRRSGKDIRRATSAKTKAAAEALLSEISAKQTREELGLEQTVTRTKLTVWELCKWWLENKCPQQSLKVETSRLTLHVGKTELGRLHVYQIKPTHLEEHFDTMSRAGASPGSVNHLRSKIRTVFESARRTGLVVRVNPTKDTKIRKVPKKNHTTLDPSECVRLLNFTPPQWRGFFAVCAYLALRKGEAAGLLKSDVDLQNMVISIGRSYGRDTTKGGHQDELPIPEVLLPYIRQGLKTKGRWLFPDENGAMRQWHCKPGKILTTALNRIGITKKMRFHDLRHTTATILLRAGTPPQIVQKILRHASINTTVTTYGHLVTNDLRSAFDALKEVGTKRAQYPVLSVV